MTDKQALIAYRLKQATETLADAEEMLKTGISLRSVTNRSYYSIFYAVLALFIKEDINLKTSKHAGIISLFDKEFVHTGKIEKSYSKMLHKIFDARQEGDYREFAEQTTEDVAHFVKIAREFIERIKKVIEGA